MNNDISAEPYTGIPRLATPSQNMNSAEELSTSMCSNLLGYVEVTVGQLTRLTN